jgi:uncharacterized damage-inducible protein DinB
MKTRDALIAELDLESPFTRRTLERVPLEKHAWKPHDRSMSLGDLATFLSVMWSWGVVVVDQDSFDPSARPDAGKRPEIPATTGALLKLFDDNVAAFRAALGRATDEHLRLNWRLLAKGEEFFNQPRWIVLRTFILNHAVHHRAQLGVYLRMNGIPVPAIYNDSADEKGGLFRP